MYLTEYYSDVSIRVFWNEINILISGVKQMALHSVGEPHPVS